MWAIEISTLSKATPEAIWQLWTDVAHWHRWDDEIEASSLEGEFAVGARGRLRPKEVPEPLPFTLTAVTPREAFTDVTTVPGATLEFWHRVVAAEEGTCLAHGARIRGPEWQRYARILGGKIASGMCRAIAKLSDLAEAESR